VLLAVREVAGEDRARGAAAFFTLAPAAVFWTSGDAVFLGVGSWAVALLVLATGLRGARAGTAALGGGLLFGIGLFLSYGLVLLALVPAAVAARRRRLGVLAVAVVPVLLVGVGFATLGFSWFVGLVTTRHEYAESVARLRPYAYFVVANLAALAVAVGPAVWAAVARLRDRGLWLLAGSALAAVLAADLSGLSKGEVERIWLPFMPWLVAATGAPFETLGEGRAWLAVQVTWAIGLQLVVASPW
jgi:hypothetical protein